MSTATEVAKLCIALDRKVHEYAELATARAGAEVDFKVARAQRIMRARSDGAKSIAEAETTATADPAVESLWRVYLIADGSADACGKSIGALRERIGFGRSLIATERAADSLHADGVGGAA
ncbi:MAG TPA: hypothetical protein VNJ04_19305 [Gemmatimonadaceae bacterium]|nr:hypothetical protein [Gemmatimonadaceae bacterium]